VLPEGGLPELHQLLNVFRSNIRAVQNYTPRPYTGQVTLFQAGAELAGSEEPVDSTLGWARLALNPLEIYIVPGDHYTILAEPYVQTLAERLRSCLNRAAEKHELRQ